MRVAISHISPKLDVTVTGREPWLAQLYRDLPPAQAEAGEVYTAPLLTANLTLRLEEAGSVQVAGAVSIAPMVNCSRCARLIPWPLHIPVSVRFLPAALNPRSKELNLSRADLDAYYLDDDEVDLEQLLNDLVQTALPARFLPLSEDGKGCTSCGDLVADEVVYGHSSASAEASPFAVLKGLKLPN